MQDTLRTIEELEAELRSRGATFHVSGDFDEELCESFFRHVLAFEDEPTTTIREHLGALGHDMPRDLWSLIARLAELNIVIEHTDHLDDVALFEFLLGYLDEPVHVPNDPGMIMHIDLIGSGSDEDNALFLRYYATAEDRQHWRCEFPEEEIPARKSPPFDRDRFLPTSESLQASAACGGWRND